MGGTTPFHQKFTTQAFLQETKICEERKGVQNA